MAAQSPTITYVALLRGINLGGHKSVPMQRLRTLCAEIGLKNARTVLASGNLVFESDLDSTANLAQKLEEGVKERFGVECRIFVLTAQQFLEVLKADPLSSEGRKPAWLTVMFLDQAPPAEAQREFLAQHQGPELVEFGPRAVYIYYAEGIGRSKLDLSKPPLRVSGTVRNRNTLKNLESLLEVF